MKQMFFIAKRKSAEQLLGKKMLIICLFHEFRLLVKICIIVTSVYE